MGAATWALTAASILISLTLLELGARLFIPAPGKPAQIYMPHEKYFHTLRPGSHGAIGYYKDFGVLRFMPVRVTRQGIVDDRIHGPKIPGEFRIVVLGDSYTMGHGLRLEETYGRVLEHELNAAVLPKRVTVINCGVGGYAPWQEHGFMVERGFGFEPDLVVWQLFPPNDVLGTYSKLNKLLPVFDAAWERKVLLFRKQSELPVRIDRKAQEISHFYASVAALNNNEGPLFCWISDWRFAPEYDYPRLTAKYNRPWPREVCLAHWYPELEEAFEIMCGDIASFQTECDSRGVDLIAFCHSDPISLFPKAWDKLNTNYPDTKYEMNKDLRVTQECFEKHGIMYLDVTSHLLNLDEPDRATVFYAADGHFAPAGARRVGELLATTLLDEYFPAKFGFKHPNVVNLH
ncbi:MAG: hypothetical protein AMXMBFR84_15900 [Candidatus Hydrogenedentota bacterium]